LYEHKQVFNKDNTMTRTTTISQNLIYQWMRTVATLLAITIALFLMTTNVEAQDATRIEIPDIDVSASVVPLNIVQFPNGVTTWDTRGLHMTVGYMTGTAWFGQGGNVVLGGHSEGANRQPDVFYRLDEVQVGQVIRVIFGEDVREYVVIQTYTVHETDLSPIFPTDHERLTIMTCDTASYAEGYYPQRDIVVAVPR
jgi:LPXTG-site transpeptidase (sortase) family protein